MQLTWVSVGYGYQVPAAHPYPKISREPNQSLLAFVLAFVFEKCTREYCEYNIHSWSNCRWTRKSGVRRWKFFIPYVCICAYVCDCVALVRMFFLILALAFSFMSHMWTGLNFRGSRDEVRLRTFARKSSYIDFYPKAFTTNNVFMRYLCCVATHLDLLR